MNCYRRSRPRKLWTLMAATVLAAALLGCQGNPESAQRHESLKNQVQQELDRARVIRQLMLRPSTEPWVSEAPAVSPTLTAFGLNTTASLDNPVGNPLGRPLGKERVINMAPAPSVASASPLNRAMRAAYPTVSDPEAVHSPQVTLQPGDIVEVKFYYTPELDVTQAVRPDGRITLQLIGEIRVQGRTPGEVQRGLLRLYEPHLKDPEIAVVVRSLHNQRVFVGGAVLTPGIIQIPARTTALEAVMQAGGFNLEEAAVQNVIVIRHRGGQRYAYKLDLKDAIRGNDAEPFFLEPQDIVYVPRTKIVEINQWIDQHINKIIPDTGFMFRRTDGRNTIGIGVSR